MWIYQRENSPSLVVIGFECRSRCLEGFGDRVMTVQAGEKELLAKIILKKNTTSAYRIWTHSTAPCLRP